MGRSQTIASNQTAAVPSLCVLVPYALLRGMDPQSNGDAIDKRVQQEVSARNDGRTLPRDANRVGIRPDVGGAYPVPNGQHSDCQGALPQLVPMTSNRAMWRAYPVPNGQHSDCQGAMPQLVPMASNRAMWRAYPVPNGHHSDCQGALPQLVPMASNRALFLTVVEQSPNIIYRAIELLTGILCQIEPDL